MDLLINFISTLVLSFSGTLRFFFFCFVLLDTHGILLELQIDNCTLPYREVYDCNVVKNIELNEV